MNNIFTKNKHIWNWRTGTFLIQIPKSLIEIRPYLTSSEISNALRPFYFLVHPDLFGRYPKAQHINNSSLKSLNNHLDLITNEKRTGPLILQFYVKNRKTDGDLKTLSVKLNPASAKDTVHTILQTFDLPTKYVENLPKRKRPDRKIDWHRSYYDATGKVNPEAAQYTGRKEEKLYSWLIKNMAEAERKLSSSEPIRKELIRLKEEIEEKLFFGKVSWQRGLGTTHLRGCMRGLISLINQHPNIIEIIQGREIHIANETGLSLNKSVILGTSEVRDQWLQMIQGIPEEEIRISKVPDMQNALSNSLLDIQVTYRMHQPFFIVGNYNENLKRMVTSLGDYKGRNGFPRSWPNSLSHLQLVVESAAGPLMLSPTGQIIAPSTCPPSLLVSFITENMKEAEVRLSNHEKLRRKEKELHNLCRKELGLEFLEKDDAVLPENMIECIERLLEQSYSFAPLLSGARVWITHYYSVMLDGEICIPWNWK